jgi:hypothetical protein
MRVTVRIPLVGDGGERLSQKCENCGFLKLAIFRLRREEPTFETDSRL